MGDNQVTVPSRAPVWEQAFDAVLWVIVGPEYERYQTDAMFHADRYAEAQAIVAALEEKGLLRAE